MAFFVGVLPLFAQDRDVVIAEGDQKSFTVVDQINSPAERKAFIDLFRKKDPAERAKAAETFLSAYPTSWLLPEVYEIIAKAKIDAGEYEVALKYGRQSLRLLPENPLLLVPLANVEV
ncbi:MAG TPA: hypothetical protein VFD30_12820, partial [Terriglobia bacterium]|nr:hypothetical protein [Terriglobia bacterium]